jgi:type VI secretion system protein ImpE
MTRPEDYLRAGQLREALKALEDQIRREPANPKLRIFLFQLLAVMGNWERALTQLNLAKDLDAGAILMAQVSEPAISCERLRVEIFSGKRTPLVFGEPSDWIGLMIQALALSAGGNAAQSQQLREKALEGAPAISGSLEHNGQKIPFEWLADADTRLGPILEAIIEGRYFWVPLAHIRSIQIEAPVDLRDVVWAPATFTWTNGGTGVGFIPSRYVGSDRSEDPAIQLARRTDWIDLGEGVFAGTGQRLLATDAGEYPLLEVRHIWFDDSQESKTAESPGGSIA